MPLGSHLPVSLETLQSLSHFLPDVGCVWFYLPANLAVLVLFRCFMVDGGLYKSDGNTNVVANRLHMKMVF